MPYLIDGHNLVPHVGLRLDAPDDELELVCLLQEFGRRTRKDIEVYFDGAPADSAKAQKFGRVTAYFVSVRSTADAVIMARLESLAKAARNWTVVSSDASVLAAARGARASTESSRAFAGQILTGPSDASTGAAGSSREGEVSDDEVRHWLNVFKRR